MLRGCEYQILHTVSAWLDLRGEEVLFVEGAEDFDTTGPGEAAAVQVKISPDPISLGQRPIQEALNNYWTLKNAAAGRPVRLKYLTRATFAVEQEKPFGPDVRGLDVWQRRPVTDSEARQLGDYLATKDNLNQEFRLWLKRAAPRNIRTELVECVTRRPQVASAAKLASAHRNSRPPNANLLPPPSRFVGQHPSTRETAVRGGRG
jgi:hypothetical protein